MKGVIVCCLSLLVKERFGSDTWGKILEENGLNKETVFLPTENVDDKVVINLVKSVCSHLKISLEQAADAFGDYWMTAYAPKVYSAFFIGKKTARDFILSLDNIHLITTQTMDGASPPRFEYLDHNENSLTMKYFSKREMFEFFKGLLKGIGKYYNEQLIINDVGKNTVKITFHKRI